MAPRFPDMNRFILILAFVLVPVIGVQADTAPASLQVRIENISAEGGMLRLGLYTEDAYYDDNAEPVAALDVPANAPVGEFAFAPVPPGIYAVQVLQDINGNGKMDFSWVGLPLEPYGFSRDARPYLGKPDFARVKITLAAGRNSATIRLQNTDARWPGPRDGKTRKTSQRPF